MTDAGPDLIGYFNRITDKYGLEAEAFLDLFAKQEHRCRICRRSLTLFAEDLAESPVVDHRHEPPYDVRGILCRGCNTAVGYVEKDRVRTRRVLGYLKETKSASGKGKGPPMWDIARQFDKHVDTGRSDE